MGGLILDEVINWSEIGIAKHIISFETCPYQRAKQDKFDCLSGCHSDQERDGGGCEHENFSYN